MRPVKLYAHAAQVGIVCDLTDAVSIMEIGDALAYGSVMDFYIFYVPVRMLEYIILYPKCHPEQCFPHILTSSSSCSECRLLFTQQTLGFDLLLIAVAVRRPV